MIRNKDFDTFGGDKAQSFMGKKEHAALSINPETNANLKFKESRRIDALIIGAGAGGLFCALSLVKSGKRVLLLEKHPVAGGYASSFKKQDFIFESAIHCAGELGKEGEIRKFLEESGVAKGVEFIELNNFARIIFPSHDYVVNFDIQRFIGFLKDSFPKEALNIDRLFRVIAKFYRQLDKFIDSNAPDWLKLLAGPFIYPSIVKMSIYTAGRLVDKYIKDEKLKGIITESWNFSGLPPASLCAFYFLVVMRGYYYAPTAYIKGGFSKLWEAIVDKIRENGSQVKFNVEVEKIITERGRAVKGVLASNQEEFRAKAVISNANAPDTLTRLLDDAKLRAKYAKKLAPLEKSVSAVQLYLGLDIAPKELGMSDYMLCVRDSYDHEANYQYCLSGDYRKCPFTLVDHSQLDAGLCPPGKGELLIMILDSYKNWQGLAPEGYKAKKKEVAEILIERAEKYLPALSRHIQVMEAATPLTMQRFSLSPEGSIYGFAQTPLQSSINRLPQKTRVRGLFLSGAWTAPGGGIEACFLSGLWAAELALESLT